MLEYIKTIAPDQPVLIAGPTASGKSAFALEIAQRQGGTIINADALQVFGNWRVLTARPPAEDEALAPHALYGHVPGDAPYSVGDWMRDLEPLLTTTRPIVVGGTGLYFRALTEGLADIPQTPVAIRARAMARPHTDLIAEIHPDTAARLDLQNPMRVARAWEVEQATGRPLHVWQDETPPPRIPLHSARAFVLNAPKAWLDPRIALRFDQMLAQGALTEARANLPTWTPTHHSARAIGAPELIAHLQGKLTLTQAIDAATLATRQMAKRQRTWFKARMGDWTPIPLGS